MKRVLLFSFLLFGLGSCKKDQTESEYNEISSNAYVVDEGNVGADGCGWHLILDNGPDYIPINLSTDYEKDSLRVLVKFYKVDSIGCGFANTKHPGMNIDEISKE